MNRSLCLVLVAVLLGGCASYAPYDYGLELQVIKMDERTRDLLAVGRIRPLSAGEGQSYLHDSLMTLQLLHDRAFIQHERSEESSLADFLRRRMQTLAYRKAPLTRADLRRLALPIADLRDMESRRSGDYRQVPLENINAYDGLDFDDYDVYVGRRSYDGRGHGDFGHHDGHFSGGGGHGGGGHSGGHR